MKVNMYLVDSQLTTATSFSSCCCVTYIPDFKNYLSVWRYVRWPTTTTQKHTLHVNMFIIKVIDMY